MIETVEKMASTTAGVTEKEASKHCIIQFESPRTFTMPQRNFTDEHQF